MSKGAEFNYKFGTKNNWRRCVWNRIVERIPVKPKDAVVIYLAGSADLDRPIAESKGFKSVNMIAVEKDKEIATELRTNKVITVNATLSETIDSWAKIPVNVVFADLCSGLTQQVGSLLLALSMHPLFGRAVIAINLMRGRDRIKQDKLLCAEIYDEKHRGKCAILVQRDIITGLITGAIRNGSDGYVTGPNFPHAAQAYENFRNYLQAMEEYERETNTFPWLGSYKSTSNQIFDSAVYRNLSIPLMHSWFNPESTAMWRALGDLVQNNPIDRQLTAIRAVRTRYQNEAQSII